MHTVLFRLIFILYFMESSLFGGECGALEYPGRCPGLWSGRSFRAIIKQNTRVIPVQD